MSSHRLDIRDLTVSYRGVPALHHVNLTLHCGRCVGLLGPNGAGKSTLLKSVAGLVSTETGSVHFDASAHGDSAADRSIAYLPQRSLVDWDFPLTVRGLVEMGRYPALGSFTRYGAHDAQVVERAIDATQLRDLADRQISALSGGQQQRAFLARAVAQGAHVYLLDEPFTGLDRDAQASLSELMRALAERDGKLVVVSHHDLRTVEDLFDDVIFLNGELVAYGPVEATFTPENIARTYKTRVFTGTR
ncbi:MAG: metal ABC transporter ATP-binding protein [Gluconacetobacter diazotrophicus]|nr:metal ABC transporter ATP-binding protein [Gluconacetobacter diazotrophicus]